MKKVPYRKKIADGKACFIKPNGDVIYTCHENDYFIEDVIKDYCVGPDYDRLRSIKGCAGCKHVSENIKKEFPDAENIDVLVGSKLTEEEKSKLKKYWSACKEGLLNNRWERDLSYSIFVICYLGWSKIVPRYEEIETALENPEDIFSQYISREWRISKYFPIVEDENGKIYFDREFHNKTAKGRVLKK